MNILGVLGFLFLLPFFSGCANYQVSGQVSQGRTALIVGNPKMALAHFQSAAQQDPDYYLNYSPLSQGVWTYVGRAYYAEGNYAEARKALERARSRYDWDNMAKLYLGLTLARDTDRQRGLKEIDAGLKGLHDWLDHFTGMNLDESPYWDPGGYIRKHIDETRGMIQAKDVNFPEAIASAESVGMSLEKEIDRAKRHEQRDRRDDARTDDGGKN